MSAPVQWCCVADWCNGAGACPGRTGVCAAFVGSFPPQWESLRRRLMIPHEWRGWWIEQPAPVHVGTVVGGVARLDAGRVLVWTRAGAADFFAAPGRAADLVAARGRAVGAVVGGVVGAVVCSVVCVLGGVLGTVVAPELAGMNVDGSGPRWCARGDTPTAIPAATTMTAPHSTKSRSANPLKDDSGGGAPSGYVQRRSCTSRPRVPMATSKK